MAWLAQTLIEASLGMRGSVTLGAPTMSAKLSVKDQKDRTIYREERMGATEHAI